MISWRLTLEPVGVNVAWSLLRAEPWGEVAAIAAGVLRHTEDEAAAAFGLAPVGGRDALHRSPLVDPSREVELATHLGMKLLPPELRAELTQETPGQMPRHSIDIAARGWLAGLPWEALVIDRTTRRRLIEIAVLGSAMTPGVASTRAVTPRASGDGSGLAVVDPGPPLPATASLSPVFPGGYPRSLIGDEGLGEHEVVGPGTHPMSTADFGQTLRGTDWSRLLYLGHVTDQGADDPADISLVFDHHGETDLLSARDWLLSPVSWPAPARVAIIGCGSDDARWMETSGLPAAAVNAGAEIVTATRWTLPADQAGDPRGPVAGLAVAVNHAHSSTTPIRSLRRWQLQQLDRWRNEATLATSPVYWAAVTTYCVPGRHS